MSAALRLRNLAVGHSARVFVDGIDLDVEPGRIVALIGPNGSGKTTILKTIAGQLEARGGAIEICGHDLAGIKPTDLARKLAALFTERPHAELATVRDIVEAGRYPYTGRMGTLADEDRAEVRRALEAAGVADLADRDFAHMSDGQRQRALIARALCQRTRVLLLDEPTSYLDIRAQLDMLQLLRRYARESKVAIVMSLHEIDLAQKAADHIVCIKDGHVMCQGTPAEVFTRQRICELYDLEPETYDEQFGSFELCRNTGDPEVFVIAGAGSGAKVFRALRRADIPFAAGVLFKHDVDGALARHLASKTVLAPDFEPISEALVAQACGIASRCRTVVCCRDRFGTLDAPNRRICEIGTEVISRAEMLARLNRVK